MAERSSQAFDAPWYTLHDALVALIDEQGLTPGALAEVTELPIDRVKRILGGERVSAEELTVLLLVALGAAPGPVARRAGESAEAGEADWTDRSLPAGQRHRSKLEFLGFRQEGRGRSNALATGIRELGIGVADLEETTGLPAARIRRILCGAAPTAVELETLLGALPRLYRSRVAR